MVQRRVATWSPFLKARAVAVYFNADGELDLNPVAQHAWALGKQVYLPVLHPFAHNRLWFSEWRRTDVLLPNRFSIPEPIARFRKPVDPRRLDMVLVPLVAFDTCCARVGMGGGFYDRTFSYRLRHRCWQRPLLVGVAHDVQRCDSIRLSAWDIRLDAVVTERAVYFCGKTRSNMAEYLPNLKK
jgi:5-formyltetrahydrofolate cyclo-ligase